MAVFVLFQVGYHYPATEAYPQFRDVNFGRKWVRLREIAAESAGTRPLVVMTGSSLTETGLRPSEMPGQDGTQPGRPLCYNFGQSGCGVVVQLLGLRRILDDGIRPDLVLIEINAKFLYTYFNEVFAGDVLPPGRVYWGDWPTLDRFIGDAAGYRRRWRGMQYLPWWSNRGDVQLALDPDLTPQGHREWGVFPTDAWGFATHTLGRYPARTGYELGDGGERLKNYYSNFYNHAATDSRLPEAYREMTVLCRERGVPCRMVIVPECSYLRASLASDATNKFGNLIDSLSSESAVEVIDAHDWVPDDEFIEGSHLLPSGATRFSQRLERDVLRRVFP